MTNDTLAPPTPTPAPAVQQGPTYAGWGRRVVAALLDGAVLGAVAWFVGGTTVSAPTLQPTFDTSDTTTAPWTSSGVLVLAWVAMLVLQGRTGQTPGRRVMMIRVVRAPQDGPVGGPPGVWRSLGRWCAHLLDAILLIGYLRPLWHHERRTFADSLAGTAVVRRDPSTDARGRLVSTAALLVVAVGLAAGVGWSGEAGSGSTVVASCELAPQPGTARVHVESVDLVRQVAWQRDTRLWPWGREDGLRVERESWALAVRWQAPLPGGPDDAEVLLETTTRGNVVENWVWLGDQDVDLPLEDVGRRVDLRVVLAGTEVTSCSVDVPRTG